MNTLVKYFIGIRNDLCHRNAAGDILVVGLGATENKFNFYTANGCISDRIKLFSLNIYLMGAAWFKQSKTQNHNILDKT